MLHYSSLPLLSLCSFLILISKLENMVWCMVYKFGPTCDHAANRNTVYIAYVDSVAKGIFNSFLLPHCLLPTSLSIFTSGPSQLN